MATAVRFRTFFPSNGSPNFRFRKELLLPRMEESTFKGMLMHFISHSFQLEAGKGNPCRILLAKTFPSKCIYCGHGLGFGELTAGILRERQNCLQRKPCGNLNARECKEEERNFFAVLFICLLFRFFCLVKQCNRFRSLQGLFRI